MRTREEVTHVELVDESIDGGLVASDVLGRWCHSYSWKEKNDVVDELFDSSLAGMKPAAWEGQGPEVNNVKQLLTLTRRMGWGQNSPTYSGCTCMWVGCTYLGVLLTPELEQVSHKVHAV